MSRSLPPTEAVLSPEHAQDLYLEGVAYFNAGRYFDVHEALEPLYLRTSGTLREGLQGLIQAAAAFYHLERGRVRPGVVLLRAAIARLEDGDPQVLGLDVQALVVALKGVLATVAQPGAALPLAPRLQIVSGVEFGLQHPLCLPERHRRLLARGCDGE